MLGFILAFFFTLKLTALLILLFTINYVRPDTAKLLESFNEKSKNQITQQ